MAGLRAHIDHGHGHGQTIDHGHGHIDYGQRAESAESGMLRPMAAVSSERAESGKFAYALTRANQR